MELRPEIAAAIRRKVQDGRYPAEDAVVEAALELLERRDVDFEAMRGAVKHGEAQLDRGEGVQYANSEEFKASIKSRAGTINKSRPSNG